MAINVTCHQYVQKNNYKAIRYSNNNTSYFHANKRTHYSTSSSTFWHKRALRWQFYWLLLWYQVKEIDTWTRAELNDYIELYDYLEKFLWVPDEKSYTIIELLDVSLQITWQHLEDRCITYSMLARGPLDCNENSHWKTTLKSLHSLARWCAARTSWPG